MKNSRISPGNRFTRKMSNQTLIVAVENIHKTNHANGSRASLPSFAIRNRNGAPLGVSIVGYDFREKTYTFFWDAQQRRERIPARND
jgi:hypothetical protein